MNTRREESVILSDDQQEEMGPTTLISAAKLHEAKMRSQLLTPELSLDPLYTPFIEAAEELRQKIDSLHKHKIETIKRETAEQTKDLYNKLTEAREEFKRLENSYQEKCTEINKLQEEQGQLLQQLHELQLEWEKVQEETNQHKATLATLEQKHTDELEAYTKKNNELIERLKNKIEQISEDYAQQTTNLQQKLNYQKQHMTGEITILRDENAKTIAELVQLRKEQQIWQQTNEEQKERLEQLQLENTALQFNFKEKAEKLLRHEHALKLANEELERGQQYIRELEEKNNTIQKELFDNWIHKKEGF